MKIKKSAIAITQILFLVFPYVFFGQTLDTNYFNNLKSGKVTSNPDFEWRQFGPGMAGYCEEFWIHPTDSNCYYMSPDLSNTYGSFDNGETWETIKGRDENGSFMRRVQVIEFSHSDPNFGFAIDVTGQMYNSTDKGRNWVPTIKLIEGRHSELVVDPNDDDNWYIGAGDFWNVKSYHKSRVQAKPEGDSFRFIAYGHIYRSTNKGSTWTPVVVDPAHANDLSIGVIIVDPTNSNTILAATNFGLYKSTDKGLSWTSNPSLDLPHNQPRDMDYHFDNSNPANPVTTLVYLEQTNYAANGNTVTSSGGVYTSTDFGNSWINITGNLGIALGAANANDSNPNAVDDFTAVDQYYKTIARWFGITKDNAKATYGTLPNDILTTFNRIVVNPNDKNEIYISQNVKHDKGFSPGEVWKTEDGGVNWFPCARYGSYWSSTVDDSYWASTRNSAFVPDVNTTFSHIKPTIDARRETAGNRFLEINQNGDVFICLDQQVLRSNNGGLTWEQADDIETSPGTKKWIGRGDSNLPGRFLLLETGVAGRILACSGEHGLWKTVPHDDFASADDLTVAVEQIEGQVNIGGSHSIASVAVDPADPNTIYTLQFRQKHRGLLRRSTDGGATWSTVSNVMAEDYSGPDESNESSNNFKQYNLLINPNNADRMFFCNMENPTGEVSDGRNVTKGQDLGVRYSFDKGLTWSTGAFPASTNPRSIRRIALDPSKPFIMYAASNVSTQGVLGGLFKSTNSGQNWSKMTIPSEIKSVNHIFLDENKNSSGVHDMFISCGQHSSLDPNEGGVWKSKDEGVTWTKFFDMPYVWQTEVSVLNPNIVTVSAPLQNFKGNNSVTLFNPGAYISFDEGSTWEKANDDLGQPDVLVDLKPDVTDMNVFWLATKGSGWSKGIYRKPIPLSVGDVKATTLETLSLYPNPAQNEVFINSPAITLNNIKIEIFNIEGQILKTISNFKKIQDNKMSFDVTNLSSGTYLIRINVNGKAYIKKIVKE